MNVMSKFGDEGYDTFNDVLGHYGLSIDDAEELISELHRYGVTSRLVRGKPSILIINKAKFGEILERYKGEVRKYVMP